QELRPRADVHLTVERRPQPEAAKRPAAPAAVTPLGAAGEGSYTLRVIGPSGSAVLEQKALLAPHRPVAVAFRAEEEGVYTARVADAHGAQVASQPIEIREGDREMERTGRDMENLRQWAAASEGLAVKAEEAGEPAALVRAIEERIGALARERGRARPLFRNGWVMAWILAWLGAEWALRRRFGLR